MISVKYLVFLILETTATWKSCWVPGWQGGGAISGSTDLRPHISLSVRLTNTRSFTCNAPWWLSSPGAWLGEHCQLSQSTAWCCQSHCCTVFPSFTVIKTSSAVGGIVQSAVNSAIYVKTLWHLTPSRVKPQFRAFPGVCGVSVPYLSIL